LKGYYIMIVEKQLVFSRIEFAERVFRTKQSMQKIGVDLLLVHTPENIFYLTGYQTPGYYAYQCFILPLEGDGLLLLRYLEETNVSVRSWVKNTVCYSDTEDPVSVTCNAIKNLKIKRSRIGIEKSSWFLTTAGFEQMSDTLSENEFIDASELVNKLRLVKSHTEIEYIRNAAKAATNGVRLGMDAISSAQTDLDIAIGVMNGLISAGSEYTGLPPFITTGPQSTVAHSTWYGRKLQRGDVVLFEIPGCIKRYHAALQRTAVIGTPPKEWKKCAQIVIEGLSAAIDTIKPGVTSGEVDNACRDIIVRAGYGENYRHRCGYSIGIAFPPDWGEGHIMSLRKDDPTPLQEGMTFHIPPAIYLYGQATLAFSETVLVTKTGCEPITTDIPRELVVID
jgi:Xaa-Pro dipeptidase